MHPHGNALNPAAYFDRENWLGSFAELAIDLGGWHVDRALRAVAACWSQGSLHGPYVNPKTQEPPLPADHAIHRERDNWNWTAYGEIAVEDVILGCQTMLIRDDDSDWLDIAIPTGMLHLVGDISYPFEPANHAWWSKLESVFVNVADHIATAVPFELGLIGEEVSGMYFADPTHPDTLPREYVERYGGVLLGPQTWDSLRPAVPAVSLSSGLRLVPTTKELHYGPTAASD